MHSGVFLFVMLFALPVALAVLNTAQRRHPAGTVSRFGWLIRGVLAVLYVALAIDAYVRAEKVRGGLFMASGIAVLALAGAEWWFHRLEKPTLK